MNRPHRHAPDVRISRNQAASIYLGGGLTEGDIDVSAPCRYWSAPRRQHFFGGMLDAFDLLGVGEDDELWAVESKFYGGSGWRNDAHAFADDKLVMWYDGARALAKLAAEENPNQQRLFEPDEVEVES